MGYSLWGHKELDTTEYKRILTNVYHKNNLMEIIKDLEMYMLCFQKENK